MAIWNPWRGCKKCSDGCLHCYIHKGDLKRNVNTNEIIKTKDLIKQAKLANIDFKSNR
jgi:protein gp37